MKYQTKMQIDLKKLKNNTKQLCDRYRDYEYKFADLKDNGHGLGLKIIDTMEEYGINYAMVGSIKDALKIRKFNKSIPILINYYVTSEEVYDCINNDLTITIYDKECLDKILKLKLKDDLKLQILVDNGSNLMGVRDSVELKELIDIIDNNKHLILEGIYTEITTSGIEDEFYYYQVDKFHYFIKDYLDRNLIIHLNEPLMYHSKKTFINGIRFDLSLLGIEATLKDDIFSNLKIKNIEKKFGNLRIPNLDLELVFNITSEVMSVRNVLKGTIIGRNYVAKNDMVVAVIPIGHKDGITKAIGYVGINNYKREILTDDIDRIVVEVTKDVKPKDLVYILNEERGIYDFLSILKTNRYYLMSVLNRDLTREYINESEKEGDYL